jgi:DNA-binding response OmpR family regulator
MLSNTILVVEDDPGLAPLVQRVLRDAGFFVLWAPTAVEALNMWAAASSVVPVVLIDLNLPGEFNGKSIAKQLKADNPATNIILTTAQAARRSPSPKKLNVVFDYLEKPFSAAELLEVVRRASLALGRKY